MKRRDEVTVGVLITVAVVVLVLGTLWLARGGLRSGYPLYTRFVWGQNLKQGQPVLLAGVNIGYVGDVTLRRDGYLDVMLRIDDQYSVPKGSNAVVKPIGIFGDVAVALTPPTPVPAQSYASGDTVPPGPPAPDFNQILTRMDTIGQTVSALTHALQTQIIEAGTLKDMHKMIVSAAQFSAQLQSIAAEQNRNLTQTLASFRDAAGRVTSAVDSAQIAATVNNLRETSGNLAKLSAGIDSTNRRLTGIVDSVEHGRGTLGKLLADTSLYGDSRHLIQQMDSLVADFKKNPRKYIKFSIF